MAGGAPQDLASCVADIHDKPMQAVVWATGGGFQVCATRCLRCKSFAPAVACAPLPDTSRINFPGNVALPTVRGGGNQMQPASCTRARHGLRRAQASVSAICRMPRECYAVCRQTMTGGVCLRFCI